ncbi:MAG: 3-phosphoshikimate 1-carboxyvinyltransferase, partial [Actinomycetes bacterium]
MSVVLPIVPFAGPLDADVVLPGSKSITNRALLVAALADGTSILTNVLIADDTEAMLGCINALGAEVAIGADQTTIKVTGIAGDLSNAQSRFFARQSGTTARFLSAVLALGTSPMELDADDAMRRRPMDASLGALEALGVSVIRSEGNSLPVSVCGPVLDSGEMPSVSIDGSVSSQFTSGLLLAAACMPRGLRIELQGEIVSRPYLDMTVAVMTAFGASVDTPDDRTFIIQPGVYVGTDYLIEPDASAASYFFAAAAICGGSVRV